MLIIFNVRFLLAQTRNFIKMREREREREKEYDRFGVETRV